MLTNRYRISRVTAPSMSMALISVDQAKDALGIPADDVSQDGVIGREIAQVSAAINTYCDRVFVRQGYQDQFRAVNAWRLPGQPLLLRQYPICVAQDEGQLPLIAVTESGVAVDALDMELYLDRGEVYRLGGSGMAAWGDSFIVVDYTAGYDEIPEDVQAAAIEWVSARWVTRGRDPTLRSMAIPDVISEAYTVSTAATGAFSSVPAAARDLLAFYRFLPGSFA